VRSIEQDGVSIEDALYAKDDKGRAVAKIDVYGMEPNFANANGPKKPQYDPVALKDATVETQASYASAPAVLSSAPRLQQ
jgi:hypothetical protein